MTRHLYCRYTFLVVFILTLLNIAEGYRRDLGDSTGAWTASEAGRKRLSATTASGPSKSLRQLREDANIDNEKLTTDEKSRRNIKALSEASLPSFVSDKTICHTVFNVMMDGHSWLSASGFGPFSPVTPRPTRTIRFAIEVIWLMCSEALAFQFCYADLGCATYRTKDSCETLQNPYVRFVRLCRLSTKIKKHDLPPICASSPRTRRKTRAFGPMVSTHPVQQTKPAKLGKCLPRYTKQFAPSLTTPTAGMSHNGLF